MRATSRVVTTLNYEGTSYYKLCTVYCDLVLLNLHYDKYDAIFFKGIGIKSMLFIQLKDICGRDLGTKYIT